MAATGPYPEAPADAWVGAARLVSVANPARVKAHPAAGGQGNQTDPADARAIAHFARDRPPPAWQPPTPEVRELRALVRRSDDRVEMAARAKGRLASAALTKAARRSVERAPRLLGREADKARAEADARVEATESPQTDRALRATIPGVGRQTATTVRAELPAVEQSPGTASAAAARGLARRRRGAGH